MIKHKGTLSKEYSFQKIIIAQCNATYTLRINSLGRGELSIITSLYPHY